MNLTQLRYVIAVARCASFTQAAEECFVTQPTLSNGIAQLEQEFGQRLFARTTRTVSLTSFGESILPFIDSVLKSEKELLQQVQEFSLPGRQLIRIGVSPLISMDWLRSVLEDFRNISKIDITLHEQNMADLYRMMTENLLDFVFGVSGLTKGNWEYMPLYEEPLYFIPRGDGQIKKGGRVTETASRPASSANNHGISGASLRPKRATEKKVVIDDVADEIFVMVPNACGLAQATRALFRSHRKKLREYSGEALSYTILEQWALLGFGAAILPKSKLAEAGQRARPLVTKKGDEIGLKYEAVWVRPQSESCPINQFVEHILKRNWSKNG